MRLSFAVKMPQPETSKLPEFGSQSLDIHQTSSMSLGARTEPCESSPVAGQGVAECLIDKGILF